MKKLIVFLCAVIIFFGIIGCPNNNDDPVTSNTSTLVSKPLADKDNTVSTGGDDSGNLFTVPEPATMLLLGTGLVGLAVIGRKRLKK